MIDFRGTLKTEKQQARPTDQKVRLERETPATKRMTIKDRKARARGDMRTLIGLIGIAVVAYGVLWVFGMTGPANAESPVDWVLERIQHKQGSSEDCSPCRVVKPLAEIAEDFGTIIYDEMTVPASIVFTAAIGIWLVFMAMTVAAGETHPKDFFKGVFAILVASALLSSSDFWFENIHGTATTFFSGTSQTVVLAAQKTDPGKPFPTAITDVSTLATALDGLVRVLDENLADFFGAARRMMEEASWQALNIYSAGFVMLVVTFFLLAMYFGRLGITAFVILAVTAMGPFLIVVGAFKSTRSLASGAVRLLMGSAMEVFVATVGFMLIYAIFMKMIIDLPYRDSAAVSDIADFAFGADYMAIMLAAFIGIAYQWQASTIASAISGVFLNSVGPALFAAGATWAMTAPVRAVQAMRMGASDAAKVGRGAASAAGFLTRSGTDEPSERMQEWAKAQGIKL